MKKIKGILYEALDVGGCTLTVEVIWTSDRCLPILVGRWERGVDGMECILVQGVGHISRVTVRRSDIDGLQRDDLRRRDSIGSPVPVRRSKVLCCV